MGASEYTLQLVITPTVEPVTLSETKAGLNIEESVDDAKLVRLIQSSREYAENVTHRAIVKQTYDMFIDSFPSTITVPRLPVQAVDSIKYIDPDGDEQTLNASLYHVAVDRITPAYGESWPAIRSQNNAVTVRFTSGYYDATESPEDLTGHIPNSLKTAIIAGVGGQYENAESYQEVELYENLAVRALLQPYKVYLL